MKTIAQLMQILPQVGQLEWIGMSAARLAEIQIVSEAEIELKTGLKGDHHATGGESKRQVTLMQKEHLPVIAALVQRKQVKPEELRRNLLISGINLLALKDRTFSVGEVVLKGTGPCVPCSLMEKHLGPGGYNAMRGHGGITAVVIRPGTVRIGDEVRLVESPQVHE